RLLNSLHHHPVSIGTIVGEHHLDLSGGHPRASAGQPVVKHHYAPFVSTRGKGDQLLYQLCLVVRVVQRNIRQLSDKIMSIDQVRHHSSHLTIRVILTSNREGSLKG